MNVLVLDSDGVGLDFALRCSGHGHAVKLFQKHQNGQRDPTGDGLVEKTSDWEKWAQWANLIVPTSNIAYLDRLEQLRGYGYPIFGPSKQSAQLEINRAYGMEILKKHGIEVPPYKMFRSLAEAESHCWKSDKRYVFKTLGSEEDKSLSYVAKDAADMINMLRSWQKKGMKLKGSCMLQDFIPGVEMGVSAWMGKQGFLGYLGENFEYKKLMPGNHGPNTGEMGTVMRYATKSKLFDEVLKPLEAFLLSIGHRGDIDMNVIIDDKGRPWPLEFTARLGWPAFFIMCSQHEEPCLWMREALEGEDALTCDDQAYIGLVLALPQFPYKGASKDKYQGIPINGVTQDNWHDVHIVAAKAGKGVAMDNGKPKEKDMLVTTGEYSVVVTGRGQTVRKASKAAYALADEINLPNKIVRDDVGEDLKDSLPILQQHGFATGMEY